MNNRMQMGGGRILPPAIKTIIIINVIMFFLTYLMQSYHFGDISISNFIYQYGALFPLGDTYGLPSFYPWQLITYQFMHANMGHIFFNLFALWMFGSELESNWGAKKFTIYYILAGVGAGIAQLFISPLLGAIGPTVGASGSIYGLLLAFAMTNPDRTVMMFPIFVPIKAKYMVMGLIAFDLIMGFTDTSSVAHFAHLGGAAAGFLLIKFGDRIGIYTLFSNKSSKSKKQKVYSNNNSQAPIYNMNWQTPNDTPAKKYPESISTMLIQGEEVTQQRIDSILDKINANGYQNLTEIEKKILFELSKKIK